MSAAAADLPPTIDPVAAARWARLDAGATSPWLHEEIGRRMADRLQWIKAEPRHWIDWSPLRGGLQAHALVAKRYPKAEAEIVEPAPALVEATRAAFATSWWQRRRVQVNPPPREGGVDLLWANMALHMAAAPQALVAQWHRRVASDGFLMFSALGPDTAQELRALYRHLGWPPPGHALTDMHDWGDMLVAAGFAEPVMDMERLQLTWSTPQAALAELRGLGRNLHPARFAGLRGRFWHGQLLQAVAGLAPASGEGRVGLTFEIVYGHAFKPAPRVGLEPTTSVPLAEMRDMLRHRRSPS